MPSNKSEHFVVTRCRCCGPSAHTDSRALAVGAFPRAMVPEGALPRVRDFLEGRAAELQLFAPAGKGDHWIRIEPAVSL